MSKQAVEKQRQISFEFSFEKKVDRYVQEKEDILKAIDTRPARRSAENELELCIEIAAAIKRAIKETDMSRDQVVDEINAWFGRTEEGVLSDPPTCRKPLTIHMLNNYLSKPVEYPIPSYYICAIQSITGSFEPVNVMVSSDGARVATGAELRQLALGKIEQNIDEMQKLRKQIRGNLR